MSLLPDPIDELAITVVVAPLLVALIVWAEYERTQAREAVEYTPPALTVMWRKPTAEEMQRVSGTIGSWCRTLARYATAKAEGDAALESRLYDQCWDLEVQRWRAHWNDTNHRIRT